MRTLLVIGLTVLLAGGAVAAPMALTPTSDGALVADWDGETTTISHVRNDTGEVSVVGTAPTSIGSMTTSPMGQVLLVGQQSWIGLWDNGTGLREVYGESRYGGQPFHGITAAWSPDGDMALVAGSSLLRVTSSGGVTVVHGGQDALFTAVTPLPGGDWVVGDVQASGDQVHTGLVHRFAAEGLAGLEPQHVTLLYQLGLGGRTGLVTGLATSAGGVDVAGPLADHGAVARLDPGPSPDGAWKARVLAPLLPTVDEGPLTVGPWSVVKAGGLLYLVANGTLAPWTDVPNEALITVDGDHVLLWSSAGLTSLAPGDHPRPAPITPSEHALVGGRTRVVANIADPTENAGTTLTATVGDRSVDLLWNATARAHTARLDLRDLPDGAANLTWRATSDTGNRTWQTPVIIDNGALTPGPILDLAVDGLEGTQDEDGAFQLTWGTQENVNYDLEHTSPTSTETRRVTTTPVSLSNLRDGEHTFRVRAVTLHAEGPWSDPVTVLVTLDRDGDGVPDARDPDPLTPNRWGDLDNDGVPDDEEYRNCSDPDDGESVPASDDDGDGRPNFLECAEGTDPRTPDVGTDGPVDEEDGKGGEEGAGEGRETPLPVMLLLGAALTRAASTGRRRR